EPVAEPSDGLREQETGRERVRERGEAHALPAAPDVRADGAQRDRPPDAEAALPHVERPHGVAARAPVRVGRREDVVQPSADDPERDGPERDLQDVVGLSPALDPAAPREPQRDADAREDRERVGPDRERAEVPGVLRGARDRRGQDAHRLDELPGRQRGAHASTSPGVVGASVICSAPDRADRTPAASSAPTARTAARRSSQGASASIGRTNAEPTMTPSAYRPTSDAWRPVDTPRPTHTRSAPAARVSATSRAACGPTSSRTPVTPIVDAA